ncbi:MAG: RluA family pseudouridine synthase [Bacteroidales bacterium]|nr:MAG: RluA family pseudouridine synthase [Bacteroidales bacterium]
MARIENLHNPKFNKPDINIEVSQSCVLMKFLLENVKGKNRDNFKTLLNDGQVSVDGEVITWYNQPLTAGQKVKITWEKAIKTHYPGIRIIFEDEHVIVIEKDAGILSISTEKEKNKTAYSILSQHVKEQSQTNKIFVVHRLDRETSGIMIFAKNEDIQKRLQENWNDTIIERTYIAVVEGSVDKDKDIITSYLRESKALIVYSSKNPTDGQKAITHYKTIKKNAKYSLLEVNLETGRKNQIRVHMQVIGHSAIGDKKYGSTVSPINRLGLHAQVLAFTHPITNESMRFDTPIPKSFLKLF